MNAAQRLCDALLAGRRFSVIRSIVEAHPEAVTTRVDFEQEENGYVWQDVLAIHTACYRGASLRIIQYLVRKEPQTLTETDGFDRLPLHCACARHIRTIMSSSKGVDLATVRFLIEEHPEAVMAADENGLLPIHYACTNTDSDSTETVKLFVETNPACVRCEDCGSRLPLHHYACENTAKLEVVQLLVETYPQSVQMTDAWDFLPLHLACHAAEASLEVVRYLVEQFPQGLSQPGEDENLPVHFACLNGSNQPDLVQFLIDAFPESLVDEASGCHLLHICSEGDVAHPNLVTYFVQRYPEAVKMRTYYEGDLPLHICADNARPNLEKLMTLIEADPWALVAENVYRYGKAPLEMHIDAVSQAPDDDDGNEDEAPNARQVMEDALQGCIQEMRRSFIEATTLWFNLPDGVVNHVFAFAVPRGVHAETMDTD